MTKLLQKMLNEVVVTPYDAEITERLAEICNTIAMGVKVKDIDNYIASFVLNSPNMIFKKKLEDEYANKYPNEDPIVLPPLFSIVLALYITYIAITEYLSGRDQATASLILMNYMLYRKGALARLILPDYIRQMYYKMNDYIDLQDDIEVSKTFKHLGKILSDKEYIAKHYDEEGIKMEIRSMAKITHLYHQQMIVEKYKKEITHQQYVKTYQFLKEILEMAEWKFMNCDVVTLLKTVFAEEEQKKTATIESIISELRQGKVKVPYEQIGSSSLLLCYIAGKDVPIEIKARRLTVMEFGVYVYYEMLLEYIIGEYYGK